VMYTAPEKKDCRAVKEMIYPATESPLQSQGMMELIEMRTTGGYGTKAYATPPTAPRSSTW